MDGVISHSVISRENTDLYFLANLTRPGHHSCAFLHLGRSLKAAAELILAAPLKIHQDKGRDDKTTASPQLHNTTFPNKRSEWHTHSSLY